MDYGLENRKYVIGGVATAIVIIYIIRLFVLQIMSDDYRKSADSNAFFRKIEYPSRGIIKDRNGKLLVYNEPSYDLMVIMNEQKDHIDTLAFCKALDIDSDPVVVRLHVRYDPVAYLSGIVVRAVVFVVPA